MSRFRSLPRLWLIAGIASTLVVVVVAWALLSPSRGTVTGRVTSKGKPVVVGTVVAIAHDGTMRAADLDAQGRYTIEGIRAGKVQLGVISRDPAKSQQRLEKLAASNERLTIQDRGFGRAGNSKAWFAVPPRYEDPRSSGLETKLKGTIEFNIELQ